MILTPMLTGENLSFDVIKGVNSQSIKQNWLINTETARILFAGKEPNINANRQTIQQLLRANSLHAEDVIYLLDSDVVIDSPNAFERLREELQKNKYLVCACVKTKKESYGHVISACAAIQYKHYEMIRFWENPGECQCLKIARIGRIEYVDNIFAHEITRELV